MDQKLDNRLRLLEDQLASYMGRNNRVTKQVTKQVPFPYNIPKETGVLLADPCPLTGIATEVCMHWPDGCDGLVGMAFFYRDVPICPLKGALALNDATPVFQICYPVQEGKDLRVQIESADTAESHPVFVTVTVTGVER